MQCVAPVRIIKNLSRSEYPDGLMVPCGKCIACRISKRREWSLRMFHELEAHDDSIFITLTYADNYLPDFQSLSKRHLQLFFKRLRRNLAQYKRHIRYFACGEYGDTTDRPHYHAIIFGMSLNPDDKQIVMDSWTYCDWSVPQIRQNSFGLAEPDSINYVAQYIDKKFTGDLALLEYELKNREPVFRLLSLGLGRNYVDTNSDILCDKQIITVRGVEYALPRYYIKRLGLSNELTLEKALEKDCELVEQKIGVYVSSDDLYKSGTVEENRRFISKLKDSKDQNKRNLEAKIKLKQSKL